MQIMSPKQFSHMSKAVFHLHKIQSPHFPLKQMCTLPFFLLPINTVTSVLMWASERPSVCDTLHDLLYEMETSADVPQNNDSRHCSCHSETAFGLFLMNSMFYLNSWQGSASTAVYDKSWLGWRRLG